MNFTIVGAGATGGWLGGRLSRAGETVTLVARGAHLAAMRARGLRITEAEEEFTVHPACTDDLGAVAGADVIFLTVKAHSLTELAPRIGALLGPEAVVVSAQNGLPWWYFERHGGALEGTRIEAVDPGGVIGRSLPAAKVLGGVVWPATRMVEPGWIEHVEGNRFSLGELDGSRSERVTAIAGALGRAGVKCPVSRHIRHDIWFKLLGSVAFNPISALGRATLAEIATQPESREVARAVMEEAGAVARALGLELAISVEQRLAGAERVGAHKTSMLQDVEAGRPLEVEALAGSVVEVGDRLGVPLPHLRTVYACAKLLDANLRREGQRAKG
jgi:2-dehydropantoate 2-reductase